MAELMDAPVKRGPGRPKKEVPVGELEAATEIAGITPQPQCPDTLREVALAVFPTLVKYHSRRLGNIDECFRVSSEEAWRAAKAFYEAESK